MKIGVFDSGIGGEAIAQSLAEAFPTADMAVVNDRSHLPYGDKTKDELITLTNAAIQPILSSDVIVIACNTATTAAIEWLRLTYPDKKFIGIEPMVKPAALATKTGVIAVCATPATLASSRYRTLKNKYAQNISVIEPDCSDWARMIEHNDVQNDKIEATINTCIDNDADVIVLGCTHYHWIHDKIETIARGRATVINPSDAIASRVRSLLGL